MMRRIELLIMKTIISILNTYQKYLVKNMKTSINLTMSLVKSFKPKRQMEINTYYNKKYQAQISALKTILYFCSVIIIIAFVFKLGFMSEGIFIGFTGLWFAVLGIFLVRTYYDLYMRDERKFDEYKFLSFLRDDSLPKDVDETNMHLEEDDDRTGGPVKVIADGTEENDK